MSGQRGGGSGWYAVDIERSGHGGFAGASGGGGGGGRRPWKRGDGPKGHRYEDPRRDARVQKNTGRGRGRGGRGRGGRGRGGQEGGGRANKRDTGPRQQVEGVKFDSKLNDFGNGSPIRDGKLAVDGYDRDRLMKSNAQVFEAADKKNGLWFSSGHDVPGVHSFVDRQVRHLPPGSTFSVALKHEDNSDGVAPSQAARDCLLRTMIRGDPFAVNMTLGQSDHRVPTEPAAQSPDTAMQDQIRQDTGDRMDYEEEDPNQGQPSTEPGRYQGA